MSLERPALSHYPVFPLVLFDALSGDAALYAATSAPGPGGAWAGRATLSNDWPGFSCLLTRERTTHRPLRLELRREGAHGRARWRSRCAREGRAAALANATRSRRSRSRRYFGLHRFRRHEWSWPCAWRGLLKGMMAWKTGTSRRPGLQARRSDAALPTLRRLRLTLRDARGFGGGAAAAGRPPEKVTVASERATSPPSCRQPRGGGRAYGVNRAGKSTSQGASSPAPRDTASSRSGRAVPLATRTCSPAQRVARALPGRRSRRLQQHGPALQSGLSCTPALPDRFGPVHSEATGRA